MKLLHIVLFSVLIGLAYGQGLRGFFDTLACPFTELTDTFRNLFFRKPIAQLPEEEQLSKEECRCKLKASSRIVGGQKVNSIIPWYAALVRASNSTLFCGGTIVNNWYIIKSAHCTDGKSADQIHIRVVIKTLEGDESEDLFGVAKIMQGSFRSINSPGDIAILKLNESIVFTDNEIEPGCLNLHKKSSYENELMAAGFGTTSLSYRYPNGTYRSGELSQTLKKAYFKENKQGCRSFLICINSANGDSVCNGDSGGPLHYLLKGITTVEGAASFVRGKGKRTERIALCTGFAGYSRFSYYSNWIESVVGKEYCTFDDVVGDEVAN